MTWTTPHAYARAREVSPRTVNNAVAAKLIAVDRRGRLNVERTDAGWLADHLARTERLNSTEASRIKQRTAAAVSAASAIRGLRRQLIELQRSTVPRVAVEGARARRVARLVAGVHCFPALYTDTAAAALKRPPRAVRAMLEKFSARLLADLGLPTDDAG